MKFANVSVDEGTEVSINLDSIQRVEFTMKDSGGRKVCTTATVFFQGGPAPCIKYEGPVANQFHSMLARAN